MHNKKGDSLGLKPVCYTEQTQQNPLSLAKSQELQVLSQQLAYGSANLSFLTALKWQVYYMPI